MIEKGIIVSIQKYSQITTQELACQSIDGGAVAIRTDIPIMINKPLIGLKKLENKKYYITTSRQAIAEVGRWANYIAIDSRKGNEDLELLYAHCHISCLQIVADIQNVEDVENLLTICEKKKLLKPAYISTTFSFLCEGTHDNFLVAQIKKITDIPIIAEGHCDHRQDIFQSKMYGANNICIGSSISEIKEITNKFVKIFEEVE